MTQKNEHDFFEEDEEQKIVEKKPENVFANLAAKICATTVLACVLALLVAVTVKLILWIF